MTAHGAIVYLEIPTDDVRRSAEFYTTVFGWRTRQRGDGELAFDDATGGVSGAWVLGRPPSGAAGVLTYVNVSDIGAAIDVVGATGGVVVQPLGGDPGELTARFLDPYGNLFGLYQEPVA